MPDGNWMPDQQSSVEQAQHQLIEEVHTVHNRLQDFGPSDEDALSAVADANRLLRHILKRASAQKLSSKITQAIDNAYAAVDSLLRFRSPNAYEEVRNSFHQLLAEIRTFVAEAQKQVEDVYSEDREAQLLRALSARSGRPHRIHAEPTYKLGCVLAPVGKTIFDARSENSLEKTDNYKSIQGKFGGVEGVLKRKVHPVAKKKAGKLTTAFQGELNREVIAKILSNILEQTRFTHAEAAERAGVTRGALQKVLRQEASLDQGVRVLEGLGCVFDTRVDVPTEMPIPLVM